jgi:hypothetical protein
MGVVCLICRIFFAALRDAAPLAAVDVNGAGMMT